MSTSTELSYLDRSSDLPVDTSTFHRLSKERSGTIISLALFDISAGLVTSPTTEQQAVIDEIRQTIETKLSLTETESIMAGISLDAFAVEEDRAVTEFLSSLEKMDRRIRLPETDE